MEKLYNDPPLKYTRSHTLCSYEITVSNTNIDHALENVDGGSRAEKTYSLVG